MLFIIPIGSEEGVRRLPYLTIALIAINTIIFIITNTVFVGQERELQKIEQELLNIEGPYVYRILQEDPNLLKKFGTNELRERIDRGEITPFDSIDFVQWKKVYDEYKKKYSSTVFEQFGFKPKEFNVLKMFSSMFVHANFFHLLFNMLFLWLVGCNIEDDWSGKVFLVLYLISGVAAILGHTAAFPKSDVPMIGASGAIAGIMGAFMIRHFRTKIRFAYFILLLFRPFFGTFSIYAGIALPFWFLQQILAASWSVGEAGTAYWAHIGGFVFGAALGVSLKIFGVEKKYIEPMVEDSFEKLKLSPKMKEMYKKLDAANTTEAMPLLLQIISEEPQNIDVHLVLARIYFEKGHHDDALIIYNKALNIVFRMQDQDLALSIYEEIKEKNILEKIAEKNIYNLAAFLEKIDKNKEAVSTYGLYINLFPKSSIRPKAIYRTCLLFKNKLNNETLAQSCLAFLDEKYPDFPKTL